MRCLPDSSALPVRLRRSGAALACLLGLFSAPSSGPWAQPADPATARVGAAPAGPPAAGAGKAPAAAGRPLWRELKPEQQEALAPLAGLWDTLSEGQRRKWIALSRNYATLSAQGRENLHSRMSDWSSLSVRQRAQARLNFAEIQRLAADERKRKWEAYQALSAEERSRLAGQARRPTGAAVAVQPVPEHKLAPVPAVLTGDARSPRIQLTPSGTHAPGAAPAAASAPPADARSANPAGSGPAPAP